MSAEYMHIGIPITNRKPNMTYNEGAKFWVSNVDDYDYKIEYLKFEEGTPSVSYTHLDVYKRQGTPWRAFLPRSYGAGTVISLAEKIAHSPLGADELGVGRIVLDLLS